MLILTIVILLIVGTISFFYFSYNNSESITFHWLEQTGIFPQVWIPYLIGLLILFLIAAWLLAYVFSIPKRLRRRGEMRSMSKSRASLDRGLMEIQSGDFEAGENTVTRFLEGKPADSVKYLVAARSAMSRGDNAQAEQYLKRAGDASNEASGAVRLAQAEMLLQQGDFRDAETLLSNLNRNKPKNQHVLSLLAKALQGTGDAKRLAEVSQQMRGKTSIPVETVEALEKFAGTKIIEDASDAELVNAFELLPKETRRDSSVVAAYCNRLIANGDSARAEATLKNSLNTAWSDELAAVFGKLEGGDTAKLLEQAKRWQEKHPKSAPLALAIARLSGSGQLWGKAKDALVTAAQLDLTPEVCAELGEVLEAMGDSKNAKDCFRSASSMAMGKSPFGVLKDVDTLAQQLG